MNLEKLSIGMRVSNYRKLCDLLGESVEAGNSKKAQLRKWEQFFNYRKEKNAFIITEIFDTPKRTDDRRMKYAQNLVPLLYHHLALSEAVEQPFSSWFVSLGMIDSSFYDEEHRENVRSFFGLTPHQIQKLLYLTDSICKRTLMNTLNSLQKDQIATHSVNEYVVVGNRPHLASTEESRQIQHCKDQAMAAVGAASMFAVHINPTRRIRFYETLNDIYQKQHGWDRTFTLLEIKAVDITIISKFHAIDPNPYMEQLNRSIRSAVIAHLRAEYEQAEKNAMDAWADDADISRFKLDRITAETLIHILENDL